MAAKQEIVVRFLGDTRDLERKFGTVQSKTQAIGSKMAGVGKKLTIGVTAPLVLLGKKAFDAASDLNESLSKVGVVFGKSSADIEKWAKGAATNLGISQQAALEAAGTFGNLFRAMGIATPAAANMSKKLVGLASDLASFNNANPEEVLLALRSGLVGETEPLRKFGVSLSAARIETEALNLGLAKPPKNMAKITAASIAVDKAMANVVKVQRKHGKGSLEAEEATNKVALAEQRLQKALKGEKVELEASQKAQAAYSLILKDTKLAQGDFGRTADGAANKQRILKAQFEDAAATLGNKLLPIGQKLLNFVSGLIEKFNSLTPAQQDWIVRIAVAAAALGPLLIGVGKMISSFHKVVQTFKLVGQAFMVLSKLVMANPWILLIAATVALVVVIVKNWTTIKNAVKVAVGAITGFAKATWNWIKRNWPLLLGIIAGPIGVAAGLVIKHWNKIKAGFTAVKDWIFRRVGDIVGFIRGIPGQIAGIGQRAFNGLKNGMTSARDWVFNKVGDIVRFIRGIPGKIAGVAGQIADKLTFGLSGKVGGLLGKIPGLAHGGPAMAGRPHIVGERGPELFVPSRSGTVIPNHALGANIVVNVTNPAPRPREIGDAVAWAIRTSGR